MLDFIKSLFRGKSTSGNSLSSSRSSSFSDELLSRLKFAEILLLLQSTPISNLPYASVKSLIQRFYRIALFDNHVSQEQRDAALKLADAATRDLEKMVTEKPDAVAAVKAIRSAMFDLARKGGCGSLMWRIAEDSIPPAETIPYIMKPEHRDLVPAYFEAIPDVLARYKQLFVRELVLQSNYKSHNAVLILHGLAANGDKAAAAIFTRDEYMALLNVPANYGMGRDVLENLGILPRESTAKPFKRVANINVAIAKVFAERTKQSEADLRLRDVPEGKKTALLLTLTFLRVELARAQLHQIHGEDIPADVFTNIRDTSVNEALSRFKKVSQALGTVSPGTLVDFGLLDSVMSIGGVEAKSEEEFDANRHFVNMAVEWLNAERVEFLDYFRFMMRAISEPGSKIDAPEKAIYSEDWIGAEAEAHASSG